MFMSAMVRIFSWGERLIVDHFTFIQPKVNYEDHTKSFWINRNCESSMEKTIALLEVFSITLLENGTFI